MDSEQIIESGKRFLESGNKLQAKEQFSQAVKIDPGSEEAWLLLGQIITDINKKRYCFQRVLQINPHNEEALRMLEKIDSSPQTKKIFGGKVLVPIFLVVLLFFIIAVWVSIFRDQFKSFISSSRSVENTSVAVGLPPTWTAVPLPPSTTPSATPEPTPTLSYEDRLIAAQPLIDAAMESNKSWDCQEAIFAWTSVIEVLPEYGPAYYWRAYQSQCERRAIGEINEYRRSLFESLIDINQAIAIYPDPTGDYYALRFAIYADLANTYETRADFVFISEIATVDLENALYLGSSDPLLPRTYGFQLSYTGHCEEALTHAKKMEKSIILGDPPSAGVYTVLADAYLCSGQYLNALDAINTAIDIHDSWERRYTRAMIFYGLGQLENALLDLDKIIEQAPNFAGYRYYLRALVQYDLGHKEDALEDLQVGSYNTWGNGCAAALVAGLLAFEEDDFATAIELFKYSESTCPPNKKPVWTRVNTELKKLNAEPQVISPSVVLPTAPPPISEPIDRTRGILPYPPATERTYKSGTGVMRFSNGSYITMHFVPDLPILIDQVRSLTVNLIADIHPGTSTINVFLLNPAERYWSMYRWEGQPIEISNPERFIYPDGSLYLSTYAYDEMNLRINNLTVDLDIVTKEDQDINLNAVESSPTMFPTPAVLAYATPIPYSLGAPFTLGGKSSVLFILSPEENIPTIEFVNSLTFHFSTTGEDQSTLDFSYWNPTSGGWSSNQGDNKINFGESEFQISIPDSYVTRTGKIYLSLRNYGTKSIEINMIAAEIEAIAEDGQIFIFGNIP